MTLKPIKWMCQNKLRTCGILFLVLFLINMSLFFLARDIPVYEAIDEIPVNQYVWAISIVLFLAISIICALLIRLPKSEKAILFWLRVFLDLAMILGLGMYLYGTLVNQIYVPEPDDTIQSFQQFLERRAEIRRLASPFLHGGQVLVLLSGGVISVMYLLQDHKKPSSE